MSTNRKPILKHPLYELTPPPNWRELGWKSEAEWIAAARKMTARHKAQAKAAGIPWEGK
jgi:hypothetical protein